MPAHRRREAAGRDRQPDGDPEAFVPVAVTTRSGFDESVHFGAVVGLGAPEIAFAFGDPTVAIYPRSANKPMQAVGDGPPRLAPCHPTCWRRLRQPRRHADHLDAVRDPGARRARRAMLANTPDLPLDRRRAGPCSAPVAARRRSR